MFAALTEVVAPAALERLTLVLNHVIGAEPVARARLAPHAGRLLMLELRDPPRLLPPLRGLAWRVTPAGLLEWAGLDPLEGEASLRMSVDASNPAAWVAQALAGERPQVQVSGDADLAAEVAWLLANLRWDVAADLERAFGPLVGAQLHSAGRVLAGGLRRAFAAMSPLAGRFGRR